LESFGENGEGHSQKSPEQQGCYQWDRNRDDELLDEDGGVHGDHDGQSVNQDGGTGATLWAAELLTWLDQRWHRLR